MKLSWYILSFCILCVGGGVWYFTNQSSNLQVNVSPTQQKESAGTFSGVNSFNELLARNENLHCDFTASDETMTTKGTFYTAENQFRINAITTMTEGESQTNMLATRDNFYTWNTSEYGTFAFMINRSETDQSASQNYDSGTMSMNNNVTYDCATWEPDEDTFAPPENIEFSEMSEMFNIGALQSNN